MRDLTHIRDAIETLLAALSGEALLDDGVTLRLGPIVTMTLARTASLAPTASLSFDPPPTILAHRGPLPLRCTLTSITIGPDEVHASIEG